MKNYCSTEIIIRLHVLMKKCRTEVLYMICRFILSSNSCVSIKFFLQISFNAGCQAFHLWTSVQLCKIFRKVGLVFKATKYQKSLLGDCTCFKCVYHHFNLILFIFWVCIIISILPFQVHYWNIHLLLIYSCETSPNVKKLFFVSQENSDFIEFKESCALPSFKRII